MARYKPACKLIGKNGNIFNLVALATKVLREEGLKEEANELLPRIQAEAKSYDAALNIIAEYVTVV